MADCMIFPDTVEEFMEQYKVVDTGQVYSNGTEFVPIFRMEQWFEHEKMMKTTQPERKKGRWERHYSRPNVYADLYWHCSKCGYKNDNQSADIYHNYCPNCGAEMTEGEDA